MTAKADRDQVKDALAWLERRGTKRNREGMARYAIHSPKMFGVSVADIRRYARQIGRDHRLAVALWDSGWYEARMLAAFVDDPQQLTSAQMDRWTRDFDNWAICDTVCFHLYDRSPLAWSKVSSWARRRDEFVRRAAMALVASLALHDREAADSRFVALLPLIERTAHDERNFVKKGVSWALRSVGRRSPALHAAALELAHRLAASDEAAARWIGRDALRDLQKTRTPRKGAPRRRRT